MNSLRLKSIFVLAGVGALTVAVMAAEDQVKRGDCPDRQALSVKVACGTGPEAEHEVARCSTGCCDLKSLRQQALAACPDASRAKDFNSTRSNRRNIAPPDEDNSGTKADAKRSQAKRKGDGSNERGRKGRNPQTGKEIKIPADDDTDADGVADGEEKTDDGGIP